MLERLAVEPRGGRGLRAPGDLPPELARALVVPPAEGTEDAFEHLRLLRRRPAEPARRTGRRRANVAQAARLPRVLLVAEVAHQVEHPAAMGLGIADDE